MDARQVLFYDGECGLCSRAVRFVLRHERNHELAFVSLQSPVAQNRLAALGVTLVPPYLTMFYADGDRVWSRSLGAIQLATRHLRAPWSWLARAASHLPKSLADSMYSWVAKNRFRVFGRSDLCELPAPEHRQRFL